MGYATLTHPTQLKLYGLDIKNAKPRRKVKITGPSALARISTGHAMICPTSQICLHSASLEPLRAEKSPARKLRIALRFQADLGRPVPLEKIFRWSRRANQRYQLAPSHPRGGADRDRHERGMGCDGRGSVGRGRFVRRAVFRE